MCSRSVLQVLAHSLASSVLALPGSVSWSRGLRSSATWLNRQRKKAKVQGLQQQIEELNVQLQKLEATTNEVRQLEQRNQEYEQQLWSQHAEVKRIQEQLQERARISSATDHYKERTDKVGGSRQQQLERATNEWLRQVLLYVAVMCVPCCRRRQMCCVVPALLQV